ncbi:D-2-hydroxyacid dehydrogenase [Helicovermis profundi]|uniref:D-2-hydroxyacid dehydrogenase n=1 Tax=Helicovermis profundi TaxID=3065157 RepID=A0AAU9EQA0_9FIRM|nr:D-2-hydroxyacid dehydrogenase [Clostridia bacterium S502]
MNIVILDGYTSNPGDLSWEGFNKFGQVTVYDRTSDSLVIERIKNAEIIFINKISITKEIMSNSPKLKYIGVLATGYNMVDIEGANQYGITVTNVPSYSTSSVAQYVFALLLDICHKVELHSESVHKGEWSKSLDFCYWKTPQIELSGKTIGIIGYGKIGKKTTEIALAFGMKVLIYNRSKVNEVETNFKKFVSLESLYKMSDIISLHVPLFDSTKNIINNDSIKLMKKGVILINTSRGGLIDDKAIVENLENGKIKAAAIDVVKEEPISKDSILLRAPNLIITPHIAWAPLEARERLMKIAVKNLETFINGNAINVVNN